MLIVYPAIFREEDNKYWVEFPDLPGCQTCGGSLPETIKYAEEALGLFLATVEEDNIKFADATDISDVKSDDGFVSLIYTDIDKYRRKNKAVKKTLTIPQWLNEEAEKRHINFSSVLTEALRAQLRI